MVPFMKEKPDTVKDTERVKSPTRMAESSKANSNMAEPLATVL